VLYQIICSIWNTISAFITKKGVVMSETGIITINGVDYALESLSKEAKTQITNMKIVDVHIGKLKQELAIANAARHTYSNILQLELPKAANA
jgi:hypothetical protein